MKKRYCETIETQELKKVKIKEEIGPTVVLIGTTEEYAISSVISKAGNKSFKIA